VSDTSLTESGDRRWDLAGPLDFSSVPRIWPALEKALQSGDGMTLSLSSVSRANSAGLVLLIEALDLARRSGCRLRLYDVPSELLDLAGMSSCEELIRENAA